jgi:hypothetical protein
LNLYFLVAATPGFADQGQFTFGVGYRVDNLFYFLFCDWKSSWTLLYKPIDENERKEIDEIIKVSKSLKRAYSNFFQNCNASLIQKIKERDFSLISEITSIVKIPSSSSNFCLDDPNLTKSVNVSSLKQNATKCLNQCSEKLSKSREVSEGEQDAQIFEVRE